MKKTLVFILSLIFMFSALSGCGDETLEKTVYKVFVSTTAGGELMADKKDVNIGEAVTFTLVPDDGYVIHSFIINGGKVTPIKNTADGSKDTYTWTMPAVVSDIDASVVYALPDVVVNFDANEGTCKTENLNVELNKPIGELPMPYRAEYRFKGWFDEGGNEYVKTSIVDITGGTLNLTAKWEQVSDEEKNGVVPYSVTSTYYDMAATKYGVVWHTEKEPIASVIQAVKKPEGADFPRELSGEISFADATNTFCSYQEYFYDHYVSTGVLEGLEFGTTYAVRVGDITGDKWSEVYEFTTRAEQIDVAKFVFLCDTQEADSFDNRIESINLNGKSYFEATLIDALNRFPDSQFIAHGGDMFNYGSELKFVRQLLDSVQKYAFKYPIAVSAGNHEGDNWYSTGMENLSILFNYNATQFDNVRGDFYSFDLGPMHFITLRSNDVFSTYDGVSRRLSPTQIEWLVNDLESVDRRVTPWVIAMMHDSPIQYGGAAYGDSMGPQLMPILTEHNVDLMLYGHNHFLQSTYPVKWDESLENPNVGNSCKLTATTTSFVEVDYDGVKVDKFDFSALSEGDKRGTVFHEDGCANYLYSTAGSWSNKGIITTGGIKWRTVFGGGYSAVKDIPGIETNTNYVMYSYLEVSANQLVCRTYGVNAPKLAKTNPEDKTSCGVYFDGFMLNK